MQGLCRLCLQAEQHDAIPLFRDDINDGSLQLRLQIADLCSIVISEEDNLPKFICYECKVKLQNAYEFVNLCKQSNNKLQEDYERDKYHQIRKPTSPKENKPKQITDKKHKLVDISSRSTKKSLRECSEVPAHLQTPVSALHQSLSVENTETTDLKSDNNDASSPHFTIQGQITPLTHHVGSKSLTGQEKKYLCDVCSKTFVSMSGLRFHVKSHYDLKPHACQYCGKAFAIPSYRKRHERTHTGDKHICHICSTVFASSNGLKYHLRTHTGEANYRCSTCGKSFARYKYLKEHTFTHTGEKPFVCKLCSCAYSNSGTLFAHVRKCKSRHACNFQCDFSNAAVVKDNGLTSKYSL